MKIGKVQSFQKHFLLDFLKINSYTKVINCINSTNDDTVFVFLSTNASSCLFSSGDVTHKLLS